MVRATSKRIPYEYPAFVENVKVEGPASRNLFVIEGVTVPASPLKELARANIALWVENAKGGVLVRAIFLALEGATLAQILRLTREHGAILHPFRYSFESNGSTRTCHLLVISRRMLRAPADRRETKKQVPDHAPRDVWEYLKSHSTLVDGLPKCWSDVFKIPSCFDQVFKPLRLCDI